MGGEGGAAPGRGWLRAASFFRPFPAGGPSLPRFPSGMRSASSFGEGRGAAPDLRWLASLIVVSSRLPPVAASILGDPRLAGGGRAVVLTLQCRDPPAPTSHRPPHAPGSRR